MTIADRFSSGRWLITLFSGLALLGLAVADIIVAIRAPGAPVPFSPEAIFAIISSVAAFYFSKAPDTSK